jgi:HSP20 family protein
MSDDNRKNLRDMLDELDKYFEDMEKEIEVAVRDSVSKGHQFFSRPFVAGMQFRMGPEGKPSVQFFGDKPQSEGFRAPMHEQILDEKNGTLKLVIELPGVEKSDIEVSVAENKVGVKAEVGTRKYRTEIQLRADVDPESGKAEYNNGVLEISLNLKDKTNKGFRRLSVV